MLRLTFILAFILLLLLAVMNNFVSRCMVSILLLTIVIFWMTNDIYKSIIIALLIGIVIYFMRPQLDEGFEGNDKNNDKMTKIIDELNSLADKDKDAEVEPNLAVPKNDEEVDEKDTENLFNKEEDEKDAREGSGNEIPDMGSKYISKLTPSQAQKETFRLINTLKQLDDTIQNMAPTLKEGAKIIEKFKKLNIK